MIQLKFFQPIQHCFAFIDSNKFYRSIQIKKRKKSIEIFLVSVTLLTDEIYFKMESLSLIDKTN